MNQRASLTIYLPAFLSLLGGCIIVGGTTGTGGAGGAGNSTITTTTTSSSSSSSSGDGGFGGIGEGGAGVGGGGTGECVTDMDGILDLAACEALNTQTTGNVCGTNKDLAPLANGTCSHGFEIYQRGAYDVLVSCLKTIEGDAVNACNDQLVIDCLGKMYAAACPSADAAAICDAIAMQGCNPGDTFKTQDCLVEINPLNQNGLSKLVDCMNMSPEPDCNVAYDTCFAQVRSF